ncbi:MAG: hypothetical protein P8O79_07125 [Halieaceae bacterium]|nr:hypothetical protein [Halieaceae bacterium]
MKITGLVERLETLNETTESCRHYRATWVQEPQPPLKAAGAREQTHDH